MSLLRFIVALFLLASSAQATFVSGTFTNTANQADTNWFKIIPISTPSVADGSYVITGLALRVQPNASGYWQTNIPQQNYLATNQFLGQGIIFRPPNDSGPTVYNFVDYRISGAGVFVTQIFSNSPPTLNEITNALGYLPPTLNLTTNIAAAQAALATNGLGAGILGTVTGLVTTAFQASTNFSIATTNGMTSITRSNPAIYVQQTQLTAVTNGVAYQTGLLSVSNSLDTNGLARLQSATNTFATTNYVNTVTGSVTTAYTLLVIASTNGNTSITKSNPASYYLNVNPSNYLSGLTVTQAAQFVLSTNLTAGNTNGFTSIVFTNPNIYLQRSEMLGITNQYLSIGLSLVLSNNIVTNLLYQMTLPTNGLLRLTDFQTYSNNMYSQLNIKLLATTNGISAIAFLPTNTYAGVAYLSFASNALYASIQSNGGASTNYINSVIGTTTNTLNDTIAATNTALKILIATKQNGSAVLTNLAGTGAITNLAAGSNIVITVFGGTNIISGTATGGGTANGITNRQNNILLGFVGMTNGTLTTSNLQFNGNQFFSASTNVLLISASGTFPANGTYEWVPDASLTGYYLNISGYSVTNIAGVWYIKSSASNGLLMYSSDNLITNTSGWQQLNGSLPVPNTSFGTYGQFDGFAIHGTITSTNLGQQITNAVIASSNTLGGIIVSRDTIVSNGVLMTVTNLLSISTNALQANPYTTNQTFIADGRVTNIANAALTNLWLPYAQTVIDTNIFTNAYLSQLTLTNRLLAQYYLPNTVIVSGQSNAAANGTFRWNPSFGALTNSSGYVFLPLTTNGMVHGTNISPAQGGSNIFVWGASPGVDSGIPYNPNGRYSYYSNKWPDGLVQGFFLTNSPVQVVYKTSDGAGWMGYSQQIDPPNGANNNWMFVSPNGVIYIIWPANAPAVNPSLNIIYTTMGAVYAPGAAAAIWQSSYSIAPYGFYPLIGPRLGEWPNGQAPFQDWVIFRPTATNYTYYASKPGGGLGWITNGAPCAPFYLPPNSSPSGLDCFALVDFWQNMYMPCDCPDSSFYPKDSIRR